MDNTLALAFRVQNAVGALNASPSVQTRQRPQTVLRKTAQPAKPGEFAAALERVQTHRPA